MGREKKTMSGRRPVDTEPEIEAEPEDIAPDEELTPEEALPEVELEKEVLETPQLNEADVAALSDELNTAKDQLLRTIADFDNYRKRVARDHERMRQTAAEALMGDLLPVLDNLERALEHGGNGDGFGKGVELILTQFRGALEKHGLREIPAMGEEFDPNVHEALMQVKSAELPAGKVAQVLQKGYMLGDRVLRASKVAVSAGPEE